MPYNSIKKRIISQSVYETNLVAGTDITIPVDGFKSVLLRIPIGDYNHRSNIRVHNVGIFSNYADGLVFKHPYNYIAAGYRFYRMGSSPFTGDITYDMDDKTVTGAGTSFTTEVFPNDVLIQYSGSIVGNYDLSAVGVVDSITNNTALELTSYPVTPNNPAINSGVLTPLLDSQVRTIDISTLNQMYTLGDYINPIDVSGAGEYIILRSEIDIHEPLVFSRDAISADHDGETVYFEVHVDLEYTPRF
jgi:hypothetical protein